MLTYRVDSMENTYRAAIGKRQEGSMNLKEVNTGETYLVKDIKTDDEEMTAFLFRLGCYSGEPITVISQRRGGCVVSIKDGRYNLDNQLAEAIVV